MKKWYAMKRIGIDDSDAVWKPVDDVRFTRFDRDFTVAVVRDHTDDRICYCVHPARVKCVEVED